MNAPSATPKGISSSNSIDARGTTQRKRHYGKTDKVRAAECIAGAFSIYSHRLPLTNRAAGLPKREDDPVKILLISPNRLIAPSPVYPIGLDYVAGAISPRHEVQIADLNETAGLEGLKEAIRAYDPDVIGLSLRNIDNLDAFATKSYTCDYRLVVAAIREMTGAKIVLGGSGFTIFPSELMEALDADYGIVGDGEGFPLLLDALAAGGDASAVPGAWIGGSPSARLPDATNRSFRRHFDRNSPHVRYYLRQGGIFNLQTKRGCPYRCIYCTYPQIDGGMLRLNDPDEVARDALMLQKSGAKYLFITDSTFNCHADHSLELARAFIRAHLSVPWGAFFAPFKPAEDYYSIMAEAGLTHVEFGTESLCDSVLSAYGKPFRTEDVFHAHEQASDAGLHIAHYLLLGGPGEDEKTLMKTLENAENLEKAVLIPFCGMRIYPHTPLHAIAIQEGQIARSQNLLEPVFYRPPALSLKTVMETVGRCAADRPHWIPCGGNEESGRVVSRLHAHGHSGPLWEHLIPGKPETPRNGRTESGAEAEEGPCR